MQIDSLTLQRILTGETLEFFELRRHPNNESRFALIKLHWHSIGLHYNGFTFYAIAKATPELRKAKRVVKCEMTLARYVCGGYTDARSAFEAAYNAGAKRIDVTTEFVWRIDVFSLDASINSASKETASSD